MPDPRREFERLENTGISCDLGQVVNLSGGGICIGAKWKLPVNIGERYNLTLQMGDKTQQMVARAIWSRKAGLVVHHTGFDFPELDDEQKQVFQASLDAETSNDTGGNTQPNIVAEFELPNYFETLGLSHEAEGAAIQSAYEDLKQEADALPGVTTQQIKTKQKRLKQLKQAHNVLANEPQRQAVRRVIEQKLAKLSRRSAGAYWQTDTALEAGDSDLEPGPGHGGDQDQSLITDEPVQKPADLNQHAA